MLRENNTKDKSMVRVEVRITKNVRKYRMVGTFNKRLIIELN